MKLYKFEKSDCCELVRGGAPLVVLKKCIVKYEGLMMSLADLSLLMSLVLENCADLVILDDVALMLKLCPLYIFPSIKSAVISLQLHKATDVHHGLGQTKRNK